MKKRIYIGINDAWLLGSFKKFSFPTIYCNFIRGQVMAQRESASCQRNIDFKVGCYYWLTKYRAQQPMGTVQCSQLRIGSNMTVAPLKKTIF